MNRPQPLTEGQRAGVFVLGASGYESGELLRRIAVHPRLDLPEVAGDDTRSVAGASAADRRRLLERLYAALDGGNGSASSREEATRGGDA